MGAIEGKRYVAAERKPADDGGVGPDRVEQRGDVSNGQRFAVRPGVPGVIGPAVAAHVPQHKLVLLRQRLDLALPHLGCGRIAVGQNEGRSAAVDFVVDLDAVAIDFWH